MDSVDFFHFELGTEAYDNSGNFVAQFYGERNFKDDIRHKRTYWKYGHFISYLMECVRLYVEEKAHDRYSEDRD